MEEDIDDLSIVEHSDHTVYSVPILWLTPEEAVQFNDWKQQLKVVIPFWTAVFSAMHVLSVIISQWRRNGKSSLKPKDQYQWHNKYVIPKKPACCVKPHVIAIFVPFTCGSANFMLGAELSLVPMPLLHLCSGCTGSWAVGKCHRSAIEDLYFCPSTRILQHLGLGTSSMTLLLCWPSHHIRMWLS